MQEPTFHTVREAAEILRVDAATIYRSIRAGSFPAVRIRTRYVVPAAALRAMAATAVDNGNCVDSPARRLPSVLEPVAALSRLARAPPAVALEPRSIGTGCDRPGCGTRAVARLAAPTRRWRRW
jgi:excisionase family DNA binding protein